MPAGTRTLASWSAQLAAAVQGGGLKRELHAVLVWGALKAEREAKLGQRAAGLHTRSGQMIRQTHAFARFEGGRAEIVLRVDVPYATSHERGAAIRPTRGKYLTIPLGPAKTAAGVARGPARSFPGLFFIKSKKGNLLLVRKEGDKIVPYFVLVTGVRIPARPFAKPAMDAVRREIPARLAAAVRKAVT